MTNEKLTDEELTKIEDRDRNQEAWPHCPHNAADVSRLVAEVRRLRGILRAVAYSRTMKAPGFEAPESNDHEGRCFLCGSERGDDHVEMRTSIGTLPCPWPEIEAQACGGDEAAPSGMVDLSDMVGKIDIEPAGDALTLDGFPLKPVTISISGFFDGGEGPKPPDEKVVGFLSRPEDEKP